MYQLPPDEKFMIAETVGSGRVEDVCSIVARIVTDNVEPVRDALNQLKLRIDLDALGQHEADAVELVERRAQVEMLRQQRGYLQNQLLASRTQALHLERQLGEQRELVQKLTEELEKANGKGNV